jgi:hypothetical protein
LDANPIAENGPKAEAGGLVGGLVWRFGSRTLATLAADRKCDRNGDDPLIGNAVFGGSPCVAQYVLSQ